MTNSTYLLLAQIGFALLTIIYLGLLLREIKSGINKTSWEITRKKNHFNKLVFTLVGWIVFVSFWSLSGIMSDWSKFPFNFIPIIGIPLISILIYTFSDSLRDILQHINQERIVQLQNFRFFVEILLWLLFMASIIPMQMSFEGRNFDVVSGITAPVVAWLIRRNRLSSTALVVWNLICLGLLINIVSIAIMSTPTPLRTFMNEPANTIVTYFPVSLLPGFLVPLAYSLHFFSLRKIAVQKTEQ
jgi:hypothetical protein